MRSRWPSGLLDEHAVGMASFLLVVPISAIGVLAILPAEPVEGANLLMGWLVASAISTAALGLVLAIGHLFVRGVRPGCVGQRLVVALIVLAAGAARGAVLNLALAASPIGDGSSLLERTVSSMFFYAFWLALVGALVSSSARYRASRRALLDELLTRELQSRLLDSDRSRLRRDDAVARVAETTDAVRRLLDSTDIGSPGDVAELSRVLREAIDDRVRPMVHGMWHRPDAEVHDARSRRAFLDRAWLARIPLNWAVPAYAVLAAVGATLAMGWQLGVLAAGAEALTVLTLAVLERLWRSPATIASRALLMVGIAVLPPVVALALVSPRLSEDVSMLVLVVLGLTAPAVVLATCATRTELDDRGRTLHELQARLEREEWREQLEALEHREADRSLASTVHNTVQARLIAASIQLESAALADDDVRARAAIRDARAALDTAVWNQEIPTAGLTERLVSIREAWRGILTVDIECDEAIEHAASARIIADVIEECVANASRHAGAKRVSVGIRRVGQDVEIVVRDDGGPSDAESTEGVGTAWMRVVSGGTLRRVSEPGGSVVSLRIPADT